MANRDGSHKRHKRTKQEAWTPSEGSKPKKSKKRSDGPASASSTTASSQTAGIDKRNQKIDLTRAVELRSDRSENWMHSFSIQSGSSKLSIPSANKKIRNAFNVHYKRAEPAAEEGRRCSTTTAITANTHRLVVQPIAPTQLAPLMKENMPSHHPTQMFLGPCGLRRLLVEDYLRLEPSMPILLLVSVKHPHVANFRQIYDQQLPQHQHLYPLCDGFVYLQLPAKVLRNTLLDGILHETLTRDDLQRHLSGNAGGALQVQFLFAPQTMELLFREVYGCPLTLQIWASVPQQRNYSDPLKKIRNTDHRREKAGCYWQELYGDRFQEAQLVSALKEADRYNQLQSATLNESRPLLSRRQVLDQVNQVYGGAIAAVFGSFVSLAEPVVSLQQTFQLIELAETNLPTEFNHLHSLLDLDLSSSETTMYRVQQRRHLAFMNFLIQQRQLNNHMVVNFAAVITAASFAVSAPALTYKVPAYLGACLHSKTFVQKMKEVAHSPATVRMVRETIHRLKIILAIYDNFQASQKKKNQRNGSCNDFHHGTEQVFVQPQMEYLSFGPDDDEAKVEITYKDQKIPSVPGMPKFEDHGSMLESLDAVRDGSPVCPDIDVSGKRIAAYRRTVDATEELVALQRYASSTTATEYAGQPEQFQSDIRKTVVSTLGELRSKDNDGLYNRARRFMSDTVLMWRGKTRRLHLLTLPMSKEKETTKSGNGKVVLDTLHRAGLIVRKDGEWVLADDFEERYLFLCGDALSLIRLLAFQQDLLPGPGRSFRQDYRDLRVFSQAMEHTIMIPGDLHGGGFHMLGPIYTLFYGALLQPVQQLLGWKRIRGGDVSVCYRPALELFDITLTECERLLYDECINSLSPYEVKYCGGPDALALLLSERFPKLLEEMISGTDQVRCFVGNFVHLGRLVRLFWRAIRCGDALVVETIYQDFLPIWRILGKFNYFELTLSMIEEHYQRISSRLLTILRRNRTQRLHDSPCSDGTPAAERPLDDIIEDIMHRLKSMPRKQDDENWTDYFDLMPLCSKACLEVQNAFRYYQDMELADDYVEASICDDVVLGAPIRNRKRSVAPKSKTERKMIVEWLVNMNVHEEVPGRKMTTRLSWEAAGAVETTFPKKGEASSEGSPAGNVDGGAALVDDQPVHGAEMDPDEQIAADAVHLAAAVDRLYETPLESSEEGDDGFDISSLFQQEGGDSSEQGEEEAAGASSDGDAATPSLSDELPVNPTIHGKKVSVRIAPLNQKAVTDVVQAGLDKMDEMNLSELYLRKKQRLNRRRRRLYDALFDSLEGQQHEEVYVPKEIEQPAWRTRLLHWWNRNG